MFRVFRVSAPEVSPYITRIPKPYHLEKTRKDLAWEARVTSKGFGVQGLGFRGREVAAVARTGRGKYTTS